MNQHVADFGQTRWAVVLWVLALFAVSFCLNTRHNDFPYYYHPDEPGKAEQVISGRWNFHHPMLLLSTTKLVVKILGVPLETQAVAEAGRNVSAAFISVAIVAFSLLVLARRSWAPALISGGALLMHHQFYELAHYMKEDSALLMGVALTALAAFAFWEKRSSGNAALLGISCALAISGKYVGVGVIVFAVVAFLRAPGERRQQHVVWWGVGLFATLVLINAPLLADLHASRASFDRELESVLHGHRGMTRRVPHTQYWNVFIDNSTPAMWVLISVALVGWFNRRKQLSAFERVLIVTPFVYALALSFCPKSNDRYFLPATAFLVLFASIGCLKLARMEFRCCNPSIVLTLAGTVLISGQFPSWLRYDRAFQHDDTQELVEWLRNEVPSTAVIAKDNRVKLPDPQKKRDVARLGIIPQKVVAERFVADLGSLDELRAKGVTHVAVSESNFGRFFVKSLRPQKGEEESFNRRKEFYERLFREGEHLFERDRGTVIYLHPGITVYRIAQPRPVAADELPQNAEPQQSI